MSLDRMKKRAKNAQRLLAEFGATDPVQLAKAQEFVAREDGYPDWAAACRALTDARLGQKVRPSSSTEYFVVTRREYAIDGAPITAEVKILAGASDALALLWFSFTQFDQQQEYPGKPEDLALTLEPFEEVGAASTERLRLTYKAPRRRLELGLYPLAKGVFVIEGQQLSHPEPDMASILQERTDHADMRTLERAASLVRQEVAASLAEYHREHPAKEVFRGIDDFLKEATVEDDPAGPRDGMWTCEEVRLGTWRMRLLFFPRADAFLFDAFNESGRGGMFTANTHEVVVKRKPSGQWSVGPADRKLESVELVGVPKEALADFRKLAVDWGVGLVVDAEVVCAAVENGKASAQEAFIAWCNSEKPGALTGGKYG